MFLLEYVIAWTRELCGYNVGCMRTSIANVLIGSNCKQKLLNFMLGYIIQLGKKKVVLFEIKKDRFRNTVE